MAAPRSASDRKTYREIDIGYVVPFSYLKLRNQAEDHVDKNHDCGDTAKYSQVFRFHIRENCCQDFEDIQNPDNGRTRAECIFDSSFTVFEQIHCMRM